MSITKFTKSHEWITINDDDTAIIGITEHAQEQLGDIVFVDLPMVGDQVSSGEEFSVIESVKAASDIYAPLSGEILDINNDLESQPNLVNEQALDGGWLVKIKLDDAYNTNDLMDEDEYKDYIA